MARLALPPARRDVLLALGTAAVGQAEVWTGAVVGGPRAAVAATGLVMCLALAWRRRFPMATLLVVLGGMIVEAALGADSNTGFAKIFALVVALCSAAFHARHPVAVLPAALGPAWVAVLVEKGFSADDLLYAGMVVGGVWLAGHALRIRQLSTQLSQQRAVQAEREAAWQARAAVDVERARIARELHDVVAGSMTAMALHVGGIRRLLRPDQQAEREALLTAEQTGRQALAELHRLLGLLRDPDQAVPHTPLPRLAEAGDLLHPVRAGGLGADLRVEGVARPLPPGIDLAAYRILQEAITNVLKHADATRVDCVIQYGDRSLRLDVSDDGRPKRAATDSGARGLVGMRERAMLYGGTLEAGPRPGHGYRVTAVLPLDGRPT